MIDKRACDSVKVSVEETEEVVRFDTNLLYREQKIWSATLSKFYK